jgi:hypothetical protein
MYTTAGSDEKIYTDLDLDYTYNVSGMFYDCLVAFSDGIRTIDKMNGEFCTNGLHLGILKMEEDPKKYKDMNPSNGWGDYEGALNVLKILHEYSLRYPEAIFEVS